MKRLGIKMMQYIFSSSRYLVLPESVLYVNPKHMLCCLCLAIFTGGFCFRSGEFVSLFLLHFTTISSLWNAQTTLRSVLLRCMLIGKEIIHKLLMYDSQIQEVLSPYEVCFRGCITSQIQDLQVSKKFSLETVLHVKYKKFQVLTVLLILNSEGPQNLFWFGL